MKFPKKKTLKQRNDRINEIGLPSRGTVALYEGTPVYITDDPALEKLSALTENQVIISVFDESRTVKVCAIDSLRLWDPKACDTTSSTSRAAFEQAASFIHRYPCTDGTKYVWTDLPSAGQKEELLAAKVRGFFLEIRLRTHSCFSGVMLCGDVGSDRLLLASVVAQSVDRSAKEKGNKGVEFMRYTARELTDEVVMRAMVRYMQRAYSPLLVWIDDLEKLLPNNPNDTIQQRKAIRLLRILCEGMSDMQNRDPKTPPVMLVGTVSHTRLVHPGILKKGYIDYLIHDELTNRVGGFINNNE